MLDPHGFYPILRGKLCMSTLVFWQTIQCLPDSNSENTEILVAWCFFCFSPFIFTSISYIYSSDLLVRSLLPSLHHPSFSFSLSISISVPLTVFLYLSLGLFFYLSVTLCLILSFYILFLINAEHPDICVKNALTNQTDWSLSLWFSLLILYLRRQSAWKKNRKSDLKKIDGMTEPDDKTFNILFVIFFLIFVINFYTIQAGLWKIQKAHNVVKSTEINKK